MPLNPAKIVLSTLEPLKPSLACHGNLPYRCWNTLMAKGLHVVPGIKGWCCSPQAECRLFRSTIQPQCNFNLDIGFTLALALLLGSIDVFLLVRTISRQFSSELISQA